MNKKLFKIVGAIFTIVGLAMIISSIVVGIDSNKFYKTAVKTEATIMYIDTYSDYDHKQKKMKTRHDVYVSYETEEGEYYTYEKLGYYSSNMSEGQNISIYYDPENPSDIRSKSGSKLMIYIFGGLGIVFLPLGIILLTRKKPFNTVVIEGSYTKNLR